MPWVECSGGNVPEDAVMGGYDSYGGPLYVGRISIDGGYTVAKIAPDHGCAYYCRDGLEETSTEYEALEGEEFSWEEMSQGEFPANAFPIDEGIYAGRANVDGEVSIGQISEDGLFITVPLNGSARISDVFNILVD